MPFTRAKPCSPAGEDGRLAVRLVFLMMRGLVKGDAARMLASQTDATLRSVDDLWRNAGAQVASLIRLAEGYAFRPDMNLDHRVSPWPIKVPVRPGPCRRVAGPGFVVLAGLTTRSRPGGGGDESVAFFSITTKAVDPSGLARRSITIDLDQLLRHGVRPLLDR